MVTVELYKRICSNHQVVDNCSWAMVGTLPSCNTWYKRLKSSYDCSSVWGSASFSVVNVPCSAMHDDVALIYCVVFRSRSRPLLSNEGRSKPEGICESRHGADCALGDGWASFGDHSWSSEERFQGGLLHWEATGGVSGSSFRGSL